MKFLEKSRQTLIKEEPKREEELGQTVKSKSASVVSGEEEE